jgi:hypothetical protein
MGIGCDAHGAMAGEYVNDLRWNIVGRWGHCHQCTGVPSLCIRSLSPFRRPRANQPPTPPGRGDPSRAHRTCGVSPTRDLFGPIGCHAVHHRLSGHSMNTLATHAPFNGPCPRNRKAPKTAMHSTSSWPAIAARIPCRVLPESSPILRKENRSIWPSKRTNAAGAGRPRTKAAFTAPKRLIPRASSSLGYFSRFRGPTKPLRRWPPVCFTNGSPGDPHPPDAPCPPSHQNRRSPDLERRSPTHR